MGKKILVLFVAVLLVGVVATDVVARQRTVSILGVWGGGERDAFMKALEPFEAATGIRVEFTGTRDLPAVLSTRYPLRREKIEQIITRFGVDPKRPLITQVSRFDPWKDPLGVIDMYRLIKKDIPELQLALISSMSVDDPEGWIIYEKVLRRAGEDGDIYILSDLRGVGSIEVNAFQRASNVIIQKSLREGFGLTVSEGLWKERPVVGTNVGGITVQIIDGKTGFLVESVEEAAEKTRFLLLDRETADKMGREGRKYIRSYFLITRQLKDYLLLFNSLV